jgi:hypothetical protein
MSGIKEGRRGEKGKRRKGEKPELLFLVPKLLLGNEIMPQALLGTQDVKGEKPELSSAPGFPGEAQGNNRAEDFVEWLRVEPPIIQPRPG